MSGHNNLSNAALSEMRQKYLNTKRHMQHYKALYSTEQKNCLELKKINKKLSKLLSKKDKHIAKIEMRLLVISQSEVKSKSRKHKTWDKIKCEKTKQQRLYDYKHKLVEVLKQTEQCHRAEMTLWLGENRVQFSLKPKDFSCSDHEEVNANVHHEYIHSEHSYTSKRHCLDADSEEFKDVDYSNIYDSHANWRNDYLRRIIHVMDCFRVSQEAYHEIRMVSKGHLPPLSRLVKEKKVMSEEIPYVKFENVRHIGDRFKTTFL